MALLETLVDDFNGTTLDPAKWTVTSSSVTPAVSGGILTLSVLSGTGQSTKITSVAGYTARNSSISAKVTKPTGANGVAYLNVESGGEFAQMVIQADLNRLTFTSYMGATSPTQIAYDATAHAYLRMRFTSTTVYYETSPDGGTWTVRAQGTFLSAAATFKVVLHSYNGGSGASQATFDNINRSGVEPIATLVDDFEGAALDTTKWTALGPGPITVTGGKLALEGSGASAAAPTRIVSNARYTLAGGAVHVKAELVPSSGTTALILAPVQANLTFSPSTFDDYIRIFRSGTLLSLYAQRASVSTNVTYDPVAHAWWRIRHTGTVIVFEASPDGATWTVLAQGTQNSGDPNTPLHVGLATYQYGLQLFDTVNGVSSIVDITANPASITDTDTVTGPANNYIRRPGSITDGETIATPAAAWSSTATPASTADPATTGQPTVSMYPLPDTLVDNIAIGTPHVNWMPDKLHPGSITDVGPVGTPDTVFHQLYTGGYGEGVYGGGLYSGAWIGLDPISDPETLPGPELDNRPKIAPAGNTDTDTLGLPALSGTTVGDDKIPATIVDPDTLTAPTLRFTEVGQYGTGGYGQGLYGQGQAGETVPYDPVIPDATTYNYGAGNYGEGVYAGTPGTGTDINPTDNPTYGTGTYGYGIYYGAQITVPDAMPLFTNIAGTTRPPLHILGIGPWSPVIEWRGAPNYNVAGGKRPSRPAVALPPATSKGFTLRLDGGSEARAELALPRGSAVIVDEMDTDLWWRRKDPRTKLLEVIGRFNTSHVELSTSDTGVTASLQFDDYATLLAERLVLRYLHPKLDPPTSMWDKGTPVTDILAFAIPGNTLLDVSEVTGPDPHPLGKITQPYHLAPGTSIGDVFEQLNAISGIRWEWWIETPTDIDAAPKLRFQVGTRGLDKGVVLHDLGKGPSPIASWRRTGAADNYANSLLYMGSDGGVVEVIDAHVLQYGQRDTQDSNSRYDGTQIELLRAAAKRKLEKLSDRRPTYSITLAAGFWRGRSHIDIGDTVTLLIRLGKERVHEKYRVSEITVDIDDVGMESVSITLGTPLASPDGRSKKSPLMRLVRYVKNYTTPPGALDIPITE